MIKECLTCGNEYKVKPSHFKLSKYCSRECKDKEHLYMKGNNNPMKRPEVGEKISLALKGKPKTEEHKKALRGIPKTEEHKRKISKSNTGKKRSQKFRELRSIQQRDLWKTLEYREKTIRNTILGNKIKPNNQELFLDNLIQSNIPNEFIYTGDGCKYINKTHNWNLQPIVLNGHIPDWFNCNGKKKVIELFGEYWHYSRHLKNYPNLTKEKVEQEIINDYNILGFDCLVIWEDELENEEKLIEKIKVWCVI